jgi:hypothetical protein
MSTQVQKNNENQTKELLLTIVALITGGAIPIFALLIAATITMMRQPADMMQMMMSLHGIMGPYTLFLLIPGVLITIGIAIYSKDRFPRLTNRIIVGFVAGFFGAIALDIFRLAGVKLGWMPFDLPPQFGMMILGPKAPMMAVMLVGYLYHFLNGIGFALIYTLVAGKVDWKWGVVWGLFVELGMMTTPPMLIMGVGFFGLKAGYGILATSLIAHIAMGITFGKIAERMVRDKGTIFEQIRS